MHKIKCTLIAAATAVASAVAFVAGCTPDDDALIAAASTAGNLGLSAWFAIDDPDPKVKATLKDVVTMIGDSASTVGAGASYVDALTPAIQEFVARREGLTAAQKNLINVGSLVALGALDTFMASHKDIQDNAEKVSKVVAAFCSGCRTAIARSEDAAAAKALKKAHEAIGMKYDATAKAFALPAK